MLGSGIEGIVYRAKHATLNNVAVKIYSNNLSGRDRREIEQIRQITGHPNIVHFHALLIDSRNREIIGYVMEHLEFSLNTVIHNISWKYTYRDALDWASQAAKGLVYLHDSLNIVHRDIKPDNLLVVVYRTRPVVKICDFGSSREAIERSMTYGVGTMSYMAPELKNATSDAGRYDKQCDVYSMGITTWEMITRLCVQCKEPLNNWIPPGNCLGTRSSVDIVYTVDIVYSKRIHRMITSCVQHDPRQRPSMKQLHLALKETTTEISIS